MSGSYLRQQLRKVELDALMVGTSKVPLASSAVRNLGAWFDSEFTMNTHVNKLCSAAYFHLYNLRRMRVTSARFYHQLDRLLQ